MSFEPESHKFQSRDEILLHCRHWRPETEEDSNSLAPIVLLHGGGANTYWWDHLAGRIAPKRHVYALDFRGHGESSHPDNHFVGAFNLDLESMLSWLDREDVILIGHSLGAAVALDHASRFPATLGIVLIDLARGGVPGGGRRTRLALSLRRTYRTRAEAIERFQFFPESSLPNEKIRLYIAERSVQIEPDGRFGYKFDPGWFSLPSRPRPELGRIQCPSLLIRGGESTLLSNRSATEFVAQLKFGRFIEIAGAGHHVLIDQPDALLLTLMDFIQLTEDSGRDSI